MSYKKFFSNFIKLVLLVLIILLLICILLLLRYKTDTFSNNENLTSLKIDEITSKYISILNEELKNYKKINFPLILTDEGTLCPNYNKGSICVDNKQNPNIFFCSQNNDLYCNNWITPQINGLQDINLDEIIQKNIKNNTSSLINNLQITNNIIENTDNYLNDIKASVLLSNSQQYFIDNNDYTINQRKEQIKEKKETNEKYDTDIQLSKFLFETNQENNQKYEKYITYLKYILYILLTILILFIILNFLFTTYN